MRHSTRLSDAIHIAVYLYLYADEPRTSTDIAESIHTNPAYVRMLMAKLKAAGILMGQQGRARTRLARTADKITLLDFYRAIEDERPLLHLDTHVSDECRAGAFIQLAIQDCYNDIQAVAEARMEALTLARIIDMYEAKVEMATSRWGSIDEAVAHAIAELASEQS